MAKKQKSYNEFMKAGIGIGTASLGIGLTSSIVEKAGGDAAPLATLSSAMKPAASAMGAGIALSVLQDLNKKTKRRR